MFVSFLLPYIDRGYGPLFHWVMLRQLSAFGPEQIAFIADERYFCRPAPWGQEMDMLGFGFQCPTEDTFRAVRKAAIPWAVFEELDRRSGSMLEAYRTLLTEVYSPLREALLPILNDWKQRAPIEAILTWCNMPTLSRVASELGVPVIHNELGPLRLPQYQPTVYFDFQGVNGRTSARDDMQHFATQARGRFEPLTLGQLRALFVQEPDSVAPTPTFPVGVALQVEDDSNLLAYASGRTNFDLIYAARKRLNADQVLIRAHPHGHMDYAAKLGVRDDSPNSRSFIARCDAVWTLNSSVAFECLLENKPMRVLGDSPAAALSSDKGKHIDAATRLLWLNYLFLGYLTPARYLFHAEYYRWRLTRPSLEDICRQHLEYYEEETTFDRTQAVTEPVAPPASSTAPATWKVPMRYSLLENWNEARLVQGEPAQAAIWQAVLGGESTEAIFLQPPAQLLFEVPAGASGCFETAVCLHPEVWDKSQSGPCEFHVRVDGRLAFVLSIDPVHCAADRHWHQVSLPIPESATGRHQIVLETRAGGSGQDYRWAIWRDPSFTWQALAGSALGTNQQEPQSERTSNALERTNV